MRESKTGKHGRKMPEKPVVKILSSNIESDTARNASAASQTRKKPVALWAGIAIVALVLLVTAWPVALGAAVAVGLWFAIRWGWRKMASSSPQSGFVKTVEKKLNPTQRKVFAAALCAVIGIVFMSSGFASQEAQNAQPADPPAAEQQEYVPSEVPAAASTTPTEAEPQENGVLTAHFIDVGQGDASFYELPDGKTMLVDAGTSESGVTVSSYINSLGYDRIDYLVATHPHEDHIGGMAFVINSFDIGEIWAPRVTHDTQTYEDLLNAISAKGLTIHTAVSGASIGEGEGCSIDILAPATDANPDDLNDWSAVIKIVYGETSFLLTGDAGSSVLADADPGHVDVLKVGHHGSETSTNPALASTLSPQISVISCGAGNDYGNPDQSALDALASSMIYRTDLNGDIVVESDGETVKATPERQADASAIATGPEALAAAAAAEQAAADQTAAEQAAPAPATSDNSDITVYITNTGTKYHSAGCRHLSKSQIPITLGEAKAQGYEPCGTCHPPA